MTCNLVLHIHVACTEACYYIKLAYDNIRKAMTSQLNSVIIKKIIMWTTKMPSLVEHKDISSLQSIYGVINHVIVKQET